MLDAALQYVAWGWWVLPVHWAIDGRCSCGKRKCKQVAKHPVAWNGQENAGFHDAVGTDAEAEQIWRNFPLANIGIATGKSKLVVVDLDGERGQASWRALIAQHGPAGATLAASTGRAGGLHLYYSGTDIPQRNSPRAKPDGIDVRGATGYVIAPPSVHASGRAYAWQHQVPPRARPDWLRTCFGTVQDAPAIAVPAHLAARAELGITERLAAALDSWSSEAEARLRSALAVIPADMDGKLWASYLRAMHDLHWFAAGEDRGFRVAVDWSATSPAAPGEPGCFEGEGRIAKRWQAFGTTPPANKPFTVASIYDAAKKLGWDPTRRAEPAPTSLSAGATLEMPKKINGSHSLPDIFGQIAQGTSDNPLIKLNEQYAVIGNVGGKCMVMGWENSRVDEKLKVIYFQNFKNFSEHYANKYVTVKGENKKGESTEEVKQLGAHWLKWPHRRTFEALALAPSGPKLLPGNILNLWDGFGVTPAPGRWDLMRAHICDVLAAGEPTSAAYIMRYAAWAVQHPGERAEVALVFRGGKGTGKGTFANALKTVFGQHGLQIYSPKHLVGAFNGHLRNCLLLFADEAFWAGDKQGESVLKGLLTEPTLMIEQKGLDATPWPNHLHVIMAANAEWVVPASKDERRYAVFDVANERAGDFPYFRALYAELKAGGLAAMLHDLLFAPLGDWHPRNIVYTAALREQKARSLDACHAWWESVLQTGALPGKEDGWMFSINMLDAAQRHAGRPQDVNATKLGRFMRQQGALMSHKENGNRWQVLPIVEHRSRWEKAFGGWNWEVDRVKWG